MQDMQVENYKDLKQQEARQQERNYEFHQSTTMTTKNDGTSNFEWGALSAITIQ